MANFSTKEPNLSMETGKYELNFHGRVTQESGKNFQFIDTYDESKIYLQFGKVDKDHYVLDFAFPFSITQAFGIALTAFEWKKK